MKEEELNRCQIQNWYPQLKSISMKTLIHELPESFVQYFLDDCGPLILPHSILNNDAFANRIHNPDKEEDFVIVLLLRSSDSVVHDLCHAHNSCNDKTLLRPSTFFLALRKWYPSMEFRCFVRNRLLVGISQREVTGLYPVLVEEKKGS
ncbi:hypothetical protein RJ640_029847 [Escallonia rubra]|uniref:Uncharacterized protein n=1 Tax=Escallonia rubra TaxID=112253 RepID=A0AA88QYZ4_9ASTE|nr:hypothetical protein RJ640_029847 [Escallonia rubra]